MTACQDISYLNITLSIDIELYAFATFAADLNSLAGPASFLAQKIAEALDDLMPETINSQAAEIANPGPPVSNEGGRKPATVLVPIARPHAQLAIQGYEEDGFLDPLDMLHAIATTALMEAKTNCEDRMDG